MDNSREINELKDWIEEQGLFTSLRQGKSDVGSYELACCSTPTGGNSFWILYSKEKNEWYLVTWAPVYYQLQSSDKETVFTTILAILHHQDRAMFRLPIEILEKHQIQEIEKGHVE